MPSTRLPTLSAAAVALALTVALAGPADASSAQIPARKYPNCSALNRVYPHGVGRTNAHDHVTRGNKPVTNFTRNNAVYNLNTARDRDKDGIACEKH